MVIISIGELWDRPIPISEDKLLPLSVYSDIDITESVTSTLGSYNTEAYHSSHEIYDIASESLYFKNLSPEECYHSETNDQCSKIRWLGSASGNNLKECRDNVGGHAFQNEKLSTLTGKCSEQGFINEDVAVSSDGEKNDLSVDNYEICDGSDQIICPHASKALRVRSSTLKDRHCKVKTSKGLRDRRVRLSASTAVKFYDVQDRLGIDHPSKALDWLMTKAKAAIDKLPEPSYISNLNCPICSSISKDVSTAPLVNFTTNINSVSDMKSIERIDSTEENGGGAYSGKYTRTETSGRFTADNTAKTTVPATGPLDCESAASNPFLHGTSKQNTNTYSGSGRREVKMAIYPGNEVDPFAYTAAEQPQPHLQSCCQQLEMDHRKISTKNRAPEVVFSKAFDLTHGNTKVIWPSENSVRTWASSFGSIAVEPCQSSCGPVNILNSHRIPFVASQLTDMSGSSSSASSELDCVNPQAPRMIQPWWFEPGN